MHSAIKEKLRSAVLDEAGFTWRQLKSHEGWRLLELWSLSFEFCVPIRTSISADRL